MKIRLITVIAGMLTAITLLAQMQESALLVRINDVDGTTKQRIVLSSEYKGMVKRFALEKRYSLKAHKLAGTRWKEFYTDEKYQQCSKIRKVTKGKNFRNMQDGDAYLQKITTDALLEKEAPEPYPEKLPKKKKGKAKSKPEDDKKELISLQREWVIDKTSLCYYIKALNEIVAEAAPELGHAIPEIIEKDIPAISEKYKKPPKKKKKKKK